MSSTAQQHQEELLHVYTALETPLLGELPPQNDVQEEETIEELSWDWSCASVPLAMLLVVQLGLPYYRGFTDLPPLGYVISAVGLFFLASSLYRMERPFSLVPEIWTNVVLFAALVTDIVTAVEVLLMGTLLLSLVAGVSSWKATYSGEDEKSEMDDSLYRGELRTCEVV